MKILIIILFILLLISIGLYLYSKYNYIKQKNIYREKLKTIREDLHCSIYKEIIEKESENIKNELAKITKEKEEDFDKKIIEKEKEYEYKKSLCESNINHLNELISEKEKSTEQIINSQKQIIDKELAIYQKEAKEQSDREISEYYAKKTRAATIDFENLSEENLNKINSLKEQISQITEVLNEFKAKRETINAAILRERELEEKKDFYRIVLEDNDIKDIQLFRQIEENIYNKEAINRLIYEVFIKRPAAEMIKRVLKGNAPSGIYKITYIPTGESYIGKSTDVSKRWTEHIKSSLNIGTIAHSSLHTKMAKEGLWKFTFELLEEVPKDKLTEREKYYIDFYNTKNMGLNQKDG